MTEEKPWAERMGGIDPAAFEAAKEAAAGIPLTMMGCSKLLSDPNLRRMRDELKGKTGSADGMFAMAELIEVNMVRSKEEEWFRQAAKFCRAVMNTIANRPLDDAREFDEEALRFVATQPYKNAFASFKDKFEKIERVFPPAERGPTL